MSHPAPTPASPLLEGLNSAQREAVLHPSGPLLILAGAGSGKTRVLTHRVAHLIAGGVSPGGILAVTFTNKAAGEMRERILALIGPEARSCWIGTFHSQCARLLRPHAELAGLKPGFVVYDDSDQRQLVRLAMKSLDIDEQAMKPRAILAAISHAKERLITPQQYARTASGFTEEKVARIFPEYERLLRENNAADFDDLISLTVRLMRQNAEVLREWQQRFQHVLVDEYQDINEAQYEFINLLAAQHHNLCVVGDDDQSIYSWRGADIRFILEFPGAYPDARSLKLEQNYRSTQRILDAANSVVRRNAGRHEKRLWTENDEGEPIHLFTASDETDEARFIARTIHTLEEEGKARYRDCAVLYRTNAQSRALEDGLRRERMPYRIIGGQRFYDRKEIKDLLAYLRLVVNPLDSISYWRVLNEPARSLGAKSQERVLQHAQSQLLTLLDAAVDADNIDGLSARQKTGLRQFGEVVQHAMALAGAAPVTEVTRTILRESGYEKDLRDQNTVEAASRLENLQEFYTVTQQFDAEVGTGLSAFLEEQSLKSAVDELSDSADAVTLMTLHSAKGLEFPYIFIAGMEEELFPHASSAYDERQLEEERRLCYVGITRAEKMLTFTHARRRMVFGQTRSPALSRFVSDIPEELFDHANSPSRARDPYSDIERPASNWQRYPETERPQPPLGRRSLGELDTQKLLERAREAKEEAGIGGNGAFQAGDTVRHRQFGEGIVTKSEGSGDRERVTVIFKGGAGQKKLAAALANLEKV